MATPKSLTEDQIRQIFEVETLMARKADSSATFNLLGKIAHEVLGISSATVATLIVKDLVERKDPFAVLIIDFINEQCVIESKTHDKFEPLQSFDVNDIVTKICLNRSLDFIFDHSNI